MFKKLLAGAGLLAGLFLVAAVGTVAATPDSAYSFCGACEKDGDCGTGHKCCSSGCPEGQKKCKQVAVCP